MTQAQTALQKYFGYSEFRPLQQEIINEVLNKKDVFVLMPTGGGKSLCYQIPALLQPGLTVVISPLISLMKDQVDNLVKNGIKAAFLNSSLTQVEQRQVKQQITQNQLTILYLAPERLADPDFIDLLQQSNLSLFAIDEAHCISSWGHDFRAEYRKLNKLKSLFPKIPLIALTATATKRVQQDILEQLQIQKSQTFQASFDRSNLNYFVYPKQDPLIQILDYLKSRPNQSGIIYCQTRETVDKLIVALNADGIPALPYHAGLEDQTRKNNQEKFIRDDVQVVVATIAFGMGIDKPNVRFVIHYDLPSNLERFYQETGRAGRDGLPSECILLFSLSDLFTIKFFIEQKESPIEKRVAYQQLDTVINFARSTQCRRKALLHYFGEDYTRNNCQSCDNCLNPQEQFDATIITQKILSCISRLRERFGIGYTTQVLLGANIAKIKDNRHDQLSTYGIVQDYDQNQLKFLIFELIQLGYLSATQDQYSVLSLTPKSVPVLKGQEKVYLTNPPIPKLKSPKKTKSQPTESYDQKLFNQLRTLRKQIADQESVPPYIIFSDVSLQEMSRKYPQTLDQFKKIYGVGENKLKNYGELFTKEIKEYCLTNNI